jgi:hypothetical protein
MGIIRLASHLIPAPNSLIVQGVEDASAVHSVSSPTPCPMSLRTLFSHKASPFHRPYLAPSASRGKQGTLYPLPCPVFKMSSLPQPGFGKLTHISSSFLPITSSLFPLFLPHYGYFCLLFISFFTFPTNRRFAPDQVPRPHFAFSRPTHRRRLLRLARQRPGIQTNTPVFHPHGNAKVNTIEK